MGVQRLPILDVLRRIVDDRPDVRVVSARLNLVLKHDHYEHIESVEFWRATQTAAEFDVAIAPLADTDFNRSRSNVKLKQHAAGGATPWLAARTRGSASGRRPARARRLLHERSAG